MKYTEPQWWSEQLGTTNVFELVYKDKFSDAVLMFAKPFASYKIFDYDFVEVPESEYDAFWLSFLPFEQNMKGRVAMDASKFTKENVEVPESFVVFYDQDGRVLGGIRCRYTSKGSSVDQTSNLKLEYGDAEFARLSQEDQMYMYLNGNFNVTEIYKVVTRDRMLNFNCTLEFSGCMMIDPATMQEIKTSPITMDPSLPSLYLYFNGMTSKTEVVFLFQNDDKVNLAALYVT